MPLDNCPKCHHRLGPPLKSSGRQVCMKCGWSDKPRQATAQKQAPPPRDLSPDEISKILQRATEVSLNNMKPKHKQDPGLQEE